MLLKAGLASRALNFSVRKASHQVDGEIPRKVSDTMNDRNPVFRRTLLLLLLAVGPLQAQSVFACTMMDAVVPDPGCCNEHQAVKGHLEPDQNVSVEAGEDPCCHRSVQVTVDQDAQQVMPIGRSAELRSGMDPPQPLGSLIDALTPLQRTVTPGVSHFFPAAGHSGSDTWLITRRLRI